MKPSSTELKSCQMLLHYCFTNWEFLTGLQSTLDKYKQPPEGWIQGKGKTPN